MKLSIYAFGLFLVMTSNTVSADDCRNIVDIACSEPDFSTLCDAVTAAGLASELSDGHWTVFAPTNQAFSELGALLVDVLADPVLLRDILLFHAVDDVVDSHELPCTGLVEMANGQDSRTVCHGNGRIFQKGGSNPRNDMPRIINLDIPTCQGFIHVVDEVMLPGRLRTGPPPPKTECKTIPEIACANDNLVTLCHAIKEAGLVDVLSDPHSEWTVFAPTDQAFAELEGTLLSDILDDAPLLTNILLFHAVDHILFADDLRCTHRTEMANGKDSRTVCVGRDVFQKGGGNDRSDMPKITNNDIGACNGVIHVVNEVMFP